MSEVTKSLYGNQFRVTHSVGPNRAGHRLDRFLKERYRRRSREQLKRAIESGAITVARGGGFQIPEKLKPSFVLQNGDIVQVLSVRNDEPEVDFGYSVLFEDNHIIVIQKPANLPVHPAGRYFFHTLLVHLKTAGFTTDLESERKYFLVHRIDKETSGVLLLAKTREACAILTKQFANRETEKYYLAIGHGQPESKKFTMAQSLGKIPGSRLGLKMYSVPESEGGMPSQTDFQVLEVATSENDSFCLLACFPKTGRQHQIRVHAELAGVPLVGDKIYGLQDEEALLLIDRHRKKAGRPSEFAFLEPEEDETEEESDDFEIVGPTALIPPELADRVAKKLMLPRHALHAAALKFRHPTTGTMMKFESGLPDDLREFFESKTGKKLLPDLFKNLF